MRPLLALVLPASLWLAAAGCSPNPQTDIRDASAPTTDAGWDGGIASSPDAGLALDAGTFSELDASTVRIEQSLAWTDPALLDDATAVGPARLWSSACAGASAGRVLLAVLRQFARTAHSERAGPALLADELVTQHGTQPDSWDVNGFPFAVTGVHMRTDLATGEHCGEFRVSLASTHPTLKPLHFIFLYRMDGTDCMAVTQQLLGLSALDGPAFHAAARALLDTHLNPAHFLLLESVEFTVAPWEWRQWRLEPGSGPETLPCTLTNPPLFQQVAVADINTPGALRDAFVAYVQDNAAALDDRMLLLPEMFRAPSIRVQQGVPWVPLDLGGVSSATLGAHPNLRQNIEMMGCAACHTADAAFVQTSETRQFSPFYQKELQARAQLLVHMATGHRVTLPFGPLQKQPVLPP